MGAKPLGIRINVFGDLVEGDFKPFGIAFGMGFHVGGDGVEAHVFERGHFLGVDDRGGVGSAEPDVVELVFYETESDGCFIYKGENLVHLAAHPHLFLKAAARGGFQCLTIARVAATGVGPQARGVVFREGSLLEQELAMAVKDEYGEGAMEPWHDMRGHLLHDANLLVLLVDEDDLFHYTLNLMLRISPS